jgi:hypothetical protein
MSIGDHDDLGPRSGPSPRTAAIAILGSAAVGMASGIVIPTWWMKFEVSTFRPAVVVTLLVASLLGHAVAGLSHRQYLRTVIVSLANVILAVGLFASTWFLIGPSFIAAVWVIVSSVGLLPKRSTFQKRAVWAGVSCLILSLAASVNLLAATRADPTVSGMILNGIGVAILVWSVAKTWSSHQ